MVSKYDKDSGSERMIEQEVEDTLGQDLRQMKRLKEREWSDESGLKN